ncbi:MAG: hypothetical protein L0Z62_36050 [Gemmataceae bacterium]|nr:hypothetical protein [Gemmataceae bacterium]
MKYFTPELIHRGNSLDDDIADATEEEWERAIVRYHQRWRRIRTAFPKGAQRFEEERVCLHDARLLSIGRQGDTLVMVLQPEPPAQTVVILTITLDGEPVIDPQAVPDHNAKDWVLWMYEEFDLDRQKRCYFEVLFTNGWSVRVRFRAFQYQIVQRLFPVPEVRADSAFPASQPAVAQPA